MKIYNTLKREKQEFKPIKKGKIGMYVCGPTVYDEPHIGHARSAYIFDVIRRYFEYKKYDVTFVRNVTDVDDKIINKARQEFKGEDLKSAVKKVSEKYLKSYHTCMRELRILSPTAEPRALEYIAKMIKFVELLIDRGAAYVSEGDVYFDIKNAKNYGKLSSQNLEKMEVGARIRSGENKKDPLDFALWKKAKEDEPSWDSPWGKGRPGWHIECSAMSSDLLGDKFDIHAGGIDLIFPHHENEIAQSEGAGKKFARYWMHNGLLTINGQKMAKSLGNFIAIKDFQAKFKDLDLLKLLFIGSHYRNPVDYTEEKINSIKEQKDHIYRFLTNAELRINSRLEKRPIDVSNKESQWETSFKLAMDDDFNTPKALGVIFECVSRGNKILDKEMLKDEDYGELALAQIFIRRISQEIFGLNFEFKIVKDSAIRSMIKEREIARKNKDFKKADEIRNKLLKQGIILEDTKSGTVWRKKL